MVWKDFRKNLLRAGLDHGIYQSSEVRDIHRTPRTGAEKGEKKMDTIKKIEWQTGAGKTATVTIKQTTTETINADGDKVTVERYNLDITASVEGMGKIGSGRPVDSALPAGTVGRIGKLAMIPENYDRVMAALAEIDATPEAVAFRAKIAADAAAAERYEAGRAAVERAMSM